MTLYLIGHVYAVPELEVPMERVQAEDFTNLTLTKGKPRCIKFIGVGWHRRYIEIFLPVYPCYPHLVVAYH
jgi:hypothetical protein